MKIIISNIVSLNVGDASILYGEIDLIKSVFGDETEFIVFDSKPEAASRYYPGLSFRRWLYFRITKKGRKVRFLGKIIMISDMFRILSGAFLLRLKINRIAACLLKEEERRDLYEYLSADLIVSTGGTILVENYYLLPNIFDYFVALILGKPIVFFTQSLGPFSVPFYRCSLRYIFNRSMLILLRDERSRDNLEQLGVENPNIHVCADAAFVLADTEAISSAQENSTYNTNQIRVAISVRDWQHYKTIDPESGKHQYYSAIRSACEHLVRNYSAECTFLSTCQGIPEYWTDDSRTASEIVEKLPMDIRKSINIDRNFHDPAEIMRLVKHFDLVISTRLHMAILSLGTGVPVLPIAYEFKTKELFKRLGQDHVVQDIEDVSGSKLNHTIDFLIEQWEIESTKVLNLVKAEIDSAMGSSALLKSAYAKLPK